jgi:hypothetical protein
MHLAPLQAGNDGNTPRRPTPADPSRPSRSTARERNPQIRSGSRHTPGSEAASSIATSQAENHPLLVVPKSSGDGRLVGVQTVSNGRAVVNEAHQLGWAE